eukprot:357902-Chlamydomonas_euryale.AAC.24
MNCACCALPAVCRRPARRGSPRHPLRRRDQPAGRRHSQLAAVHPERRRQRRRARGHLHQPPMPPAADRDVQPRGGRAARAPARPHRDRAVGRRAVDVWRPRQGHRGGDALPGQLGYGHQREQGDDRRAVHERHPGARVPQGRARGAGAGQVPGGGGAPRWRAGA